MVPLLPRISRQLGMGLMLVVVGEGTALLLLGQTNQPLERRGTSSVVGFGSKCGAKGIKKTQKTLQTS